MVSLEINQVKVQKKVVIVQGLALLLETRMFLRANSPEYSVKITFTLQSKLVISHPGGENIFPFLQKHWSHRKGTVDSTVCLIFLMIMVLGWCNL